MGTSNRTVRILVTAIAVTGAWMVIGPGSTGAAVRDVDCDAVRGELRCICPGGRAVTLGPVRDGDGQEILYSPAQRLAACDEDPVEETTTTTVAPQETTSTTVPATTTTSAPPAQVASETVTAIPANAPAASAGPTTNRAPTAGAATISFTG